MSKKITHEQAREELRNDDYDLRRDFLFDYITQQEELEKEYNACVEHLHLVYLHSDNKDFLLEKQQKLLELYKKLSEAYADYNSSFDSYGNRFQDNLTKIYEIKKEIKELENETI